MLLSLLWGCAFSKPSLLGWVWRWVMWWWYRPIVGRPGLRWTDNNQSSHSPPPERERSTCSDVQNCVVCTLPSSSDQSTTMWCKELYNVTLIPSQLNWLVPKVPVYSVSRASLESLVVMFSCVQFILTTTLWPGLENNNTCHRAFAKWVVITAMMMVMAVRYRLEICQKKNYTAIFLDQNFTH